MKRLGALAAAVLLVVVALWVRGRIGGGDGIKLGGGETTGTIACATEVARACEAIQAANPGVEIHIEAAGSTVDGLAAPSTPSEADFDAWLVPQPYAATAAELLETLTPSPLGAPSTPIAHSRLGFYVHTTRADTLTKHCGGAVGWGCVLDAASKGSWQAIGGESTWGPLKPHLADPSEATGLLALGGAAAAVIEPPVDSGAIQDNLDFAGALSSLKRARTLAGRPSSGALQQMLATGASVTDVVVALGAERDRFPAAAASKATLLYPAPVVSAEVVAVPRRGSEQAADLIDLLTGDEGRDALTSTGWQPGAAPAAQKNSPSPGAHVVLRNLWEEIR